MEANKLSKTNNLEIIHIQAEEFLTLFRFIYFQGRLFYYRLSYFVNHN